MGKKYIIFIFLGLIFSGMMRAENRYDHNFLSFKVVDQQGEAIVGVYVVNKTHSHLLTATDIDGECQINLKTLTDKDSISFQGMGFEVLTICLKELKGMPVIKLQELKYDLSEAVIKGITIEELLKKASDKLIKKEKGIVPQCRYYGKAQYEKIVECRDTTVEYRREYGYYLTSGDIIPRNDWDQNQRSYLLPAYSARSFNMTAGNTDTLTPVFITSENIRFDVGTRKIFTLMRAIQLFSPLYNGVQYYDIKPIETESLDYTFVFSTKPSAYPNKTKIFCKGTFVIDREKQALKEMTFDYLDYQLFRQSIMTKHRKTGSPFSTAATLTFAYNDKQQGYIQSCVQTTTWKHDLSNDFILIEQPSRTNPADNKLIEQEAFYCYNYKTLPPELQTSQSLVKIHLAQRYPQGAYNPEIFTNLPPLLDHRKAFKELSEYMDMEKQFKHHDRKIYYPDNYIFDFKANTSATHKIYQKNLEETRRKLLEQLEKTDPIEHVSK